MKATKQQPVDPVLQRLDRLSEQLDRLTEAQTAPQRAAYRPQEIAAMVGLSLPLVYSEIHSGSLKTLKINNSYLISQSALTEWLDNK